MSKLSFGIFNRNYQKFRTCIKDLTLQIENVDTNLLTAKNELKTLLTQLESNYSNFTSFSNPYLLSEELPSGFNEEVFIAQISELEQIYLKGCKSARLVIDDFSEVKNPQLLVAPTNASLVSLPKFEAPKFSGAFSDWDQFYCQFKSLIGSNSSLTDVQKFQFLRQGLDPSSRNIINHLTLTDENYKIALDLLIKRYHNPRRQITLYCDKLLNLPTAEIKSASSIRTLLDCLNVNLNALKTLSPTNYYETLFTQLVLSKLDNGLKAKFEDGCSNVESCPSLSSVTDFLISLAIRKETVNCLSDYKDSGSKPSSKTVYPPRQRLTSSLTISPANSCSVCNSKEHNIYKCPSFASKSPRDRFHLVKSKSLCANCLRSHRFSACPSTNVCQHCQAKHHSFLCFGSSSSKAQVKPISATAHSQSENHSVKPSTPSPVPSISDQQSTVTLSSSSSPPEGSPSVLMATCLVKLQVSPTQYIIARAILDSASHASFITERCAQLLNVNRFKTPFSISGVGQTVAHSKGSAFLTIQTLGGKQISTEHQFIIMPKITSNTPCFSVSPKVKDSLKHFVLADPTFDVNSRVDCLLNADLTVAVLSGKPISLGANMPYAVPTQFGYVVMGSVPPMPSLSCNLSCIDHISPIVCDPINSDLLHHKYHNDSSASVVSLSVSVLDDLNENIKAFWQVEEPPSAGPFVSEEDQACEQLFNSTTFRDVSGRYTVRLPFRPSKELGNSYDLALKQLICMENKFSRQPDFQASYISFMKDLLDQGHMRPLGHDEPSNYFIPHHGIFKSHGDTSKIRVVFNASAKSTNGKSLNDILYCGPKLQTLGTDVISLFRKYPFVFSCDIEQMFRQISLNVLDQPYQCILWRESPQDPIQIYYLTTVIYGLSPSPYLALRTLRQLSLDEGNNFPQAAQALQESSFIDDIFCGSFSLEDACQLKNDLISLLNSGGFNLKKWKSNNPVLLSDICETDLESVSLLSSNSTVSVLGLLWDTTSDKFYFRIPPSLLELDPESSITKRLVLSKIAQIYDPCGWVAPVVMKVKCFMQSLWLEPLDWDSPLPDNLVRPWQSFIASLKDLTFVSIDRPFAVNSFKYQLHGFSDASKVGYAAVLYLRSVDSNGHISTSLLVAKTKVAPLKVLNIPRLELLGAYLLSNLVSHYISLLKSHLTIESVFLWCDSSVVLSWIKIPPHRLKTFVANRVSTIQTLTSISDWHHISSPDNPADAASRGLDPNEIKDHPLWWHGPLWLVQPESKWPLSIPASSHSDQLLELTSLVSVPIAPDDFLPNVSSWSALVKIVSLMCKFIYHSKPDFVNSFGSLQSLSILLICRYIQLFHFKDVRNALETNSVLPKDYQRLTPFIDKFGIVRVGGRLSNSPSSPHPILLPKKNRFVNLLIQHYHVAHGHAGSSFVQYQLSFKYWIISAKQTIRSQICKCVRCFKVNPTNQPPMMGNLPIERITPSPPFYNSGMDFAGPFHTKLHHLRKAPIVKTYMCIFVCFSTKAVHIELAEDLSTDAFLDVLQRFISRRSAPNNLYSDCGTNFVGASGQLNRLWHQSLVDNKTTVLNICDKHKINFHFLAPSAPHQGGLWERAVRSAKHHLQRILGTYTPTVFQLMSLFTRVECILNSRPLYSMSNDPHDYRPLTPSHFLVGRPMVAPPEPDYVHTPDSSLNHFNLIQALTQRFWNRWRTEYLPGLQARAKWFRPTPNLQVDDLVVIEQPHTPPLTWPLGRIVKVFPGPDGVVRKAEVKTQHGSCLRPSTRLYRLPINE